MLILFLPLPSGPLTLNTHLHKKLVTQNLLEIASTHLAILQFSALRKELSYIGQFRTRGMTCNLFSEEIISTRGYSLNRHLWLCGKISEAASNQDIFWNQF